ADLDRDPHRPRDPLRSQHATVQPGPVARHRRGHRGERRVGAPETLGACRASNPEMTRAAEPVLELAGEPAPAPPGPLRARRRILRLVFRVLFVSAGLGLLAVGVEAVVRARLVPPEDRIPTALYTRSVPWGGSGERHDPIVLGT